MGLGGVESLGRGAVGLTATPPAVAEGVHVFLCVVVLGLDCRRGKHDLITTSLAPVLTSWERRRKKCCKMFSKS